MLKRNYARGTNPNSIANLKMITSTAMAREYKERSLEAFKRNRENIKKLQEEYQLSADVVREVLSKVDIKAVDVIRMSMMDALSKNNFEDAQRYAKELVEFEQPKLSRLEQTTINKVEDLSDEELKEILKKEGLNK